MRKARARTKMRKETWLGTFECQMMPLSNHPLDDTPGMIRQCGDKFPRIPEPSYPVEYFADNPIKPQKNWSHVFSQSAHSFPTKRMNQRDVMKCKALGRWNLWIIPGALVPGSSTDCQRLKHARSLREQIHQHYHGNLRYPPKATPSNKCPALLRDY